MKWGEKAGTDLEKQEGQFGKKYASCLVKVLKLNISLSLEASLSAIVGSASGGKCFFFPQNRTHFFVLENKKKALQ